jgi:hypothetical protein
MRALSYKERDLADELDICHLSGRLEKVAAEPPPMAAAVPLDKAAELNDKVEDVSLQIIDASPQTPDVERRT